MNKLMILAGVAVAAALMAFSSSPAQAHDGCGCGGWTQHYGYNFNHSGFERPPYFALYPPVYYSDQIVRRPMGISPFAAPPGVIPAEMTVMPEPATIVNPYYQRPDTDAQPAAPAAPVEDSST